MHQLVNPKVKPDIRTKSELPTIFTWLSSFVSGAIIIDADAFGLPAMNIVEVLGFPLLLKFSPHIPIWCIGS